MYDTIDLVRKLKKIIKNNKNDTYSKIIIYIYYKFFIIK